MLGITRDLESVREGVKPASFQQVLAEVGEMQKFLEVEKQIEKLKTDQSMLRFLGSGFKEKQLTRLGEERAKFGSLIEGPPLVLPATAHPAAFLHSRLRAR